MDPTTATQMVLLILVLAALFLAYLSSKTWQVAHVVLVVCVFIASGAFLILSAKVLSIHNQHRTQVNQLTAEVEDYRERVAALRTGTNDAELKLRLEQDGARIARGSIRQAQHELKKILLDRGRVWNDAQPDAVGGDGVAKLTLEAPKPHGIAEGTILFAFEQGPTGEGAVYLGDFKVSAAGEGTITLQPTFKLSPRQLDRLTRSGKPWTLYEVMPIDRHDVFVSMPEDDLKALIPADSLPEYEKDGKPAAEDDPAERIVGYKKDGSRATEEETDKVVEKRYSRMLRDYAAIFRRLHNQFVVFADTKEQLQRDARLLQDAIEKGQKDVAYREAEKQKLDYDLEKFKGELALITQQLQTVDRYVAAVEARVQDAFQKSQRAAAELAAVQLKSAAEINRRTTPVPARGATPLQTSAP